MKEKADSNIKKPWFVRLFTKLNSLREGQVLLAGAMLGIVVFICAFIYLKAQPIVPYEEVHDITFYTYAYDKLEDVIDAVIDEECGINLKMIPESVSEYSVIYTEQGIKFYYLLDNNKIISQYNSDTGKNTTQHSSEELRMSIQMTNEFEYISKNSFLDEIPSQEEYQKENDKKIITTALLLAVIAFEVGLVLLLFILTILFIYTVGKNR